MKKILAFVLVLTLALSLCVTAFAAGPETAVDDGAPVEDVVDISITESEDPEPSAEVPDVNADAVDPADDSASTVDAEDEDLAAENEPNADSDKVREVKGLGEWRNILIAGGLLLFGGIILVIADVKSGKIKFGKKKVANKDAKN